MVIFDKFVFIELPRTGSTHIKRALLSMFDGRSIGMHEPAPAAVLESHDAFVGSVRNPWDWYISLWTIGCGRTGALHKTATRRRTVIPSGPSKGLEFDPAPWRDAYRDHEARDVNAFRSWLRLLCSPEQTRLAFPRAFGCSDLNVHTGLYTYRFAHLFCARSEALHQRGAFPDRASVASFVEQYIYITHMVRTEHLSRELEAALADIGLRLTDSQHRFLHGAPPRNRSHRTLPTEAYYDDECINLVAERDGLIIERFGYDRTPLPE